MAQTFNYPLNLASSVASTVSSIFIPTNATIGNVLYNTLTVGNMLSNNLNLGSVSMYSGSFSASNNQVSAANVTGLIFSNSNVNYFEIILTVGITTSIPSTLNAVYTIRGNYNTSGWAIAVSYIGDTTGIAFSINSVTGQISYTSTNISFWTSDIFRYRVEQITSTGTYTSLIAGATTSNYSFSTLQILSTTDAIPGNNIGALQVAGGVTISKELFVGGTSFFNTAGSLGINTTNISYNLDVNGSLRVNNTLLATFNSNTIGNIFTTGGNVGINTISPGFTLDVSGTARFTSSITTGSIFSTNTTTTNLVSTTSTIPNLNTTNITTISLISTSVSSSSLNSTNTTTTNLVSTTSTIPNLNTTNLISNLITVNSLLATTNISTSNVFSTNITSTNLVSSFTSLGNLTSLTGTFANKVGGSQTVGTILVTTSASLIGNTNTIGNIFTTGGNVGINTTSPNTILDIQKSGSAVINLQNTGSGSSQLQLLSHFDSNNYFQTTGDISFTAIGQNTTRNLRLTTGGNVLIGSTNTFSPVSLLTINGGSSITGITQASIAFSYAPSPGFYHFIGSRHNGTVGSNQNSLDFYLYNSTGATGSSSPNFGNVNSMSVTATGVGIFNSSPTNNLSINGNMNINCTTSTLFNSSNQKLVISGDASGLYASDLGQFVVCGTTDQTKRLGFMIDTTNNIGLIQAARSSIGTYPLCLNAGGGNVGINTTSPQFTLDVNGPVRRTVIHSTYTVASAQSITVAQNIVINFGTLRTSTGNGVVNGTSLLTLNSGTFTNNSGAALVLQVSYSVYFPTGIIQVWINSTALIFQVSSASNVNHISSSGTIYLANGDSFSVLIYSSTAFTLGTGADNNGCYLTIAVL